MGAGFYHFTLPSLKREREKRERKTIYYRLGGTTGGRRPPVVYVLLKTGNVITRLVNPEVAHVAGNSV